jgi:hypothetical protein
MRGQSMKRPSVAVHAEEDVFRHRHLLHERQFLINDRDARLLRIA